MTTHTTHDNPNLPIPAGATAGEWDSFCLTTGLLCRSLEWSRHDTDIVSVSVDGTQFSDGDMGRGVSLYGADGKELTVDQARALAAKLIEAADVLDGLQ
ncbi:hypothetical protein [Mycolicibacterium fortuitum]|uniref:hypothetical protein n=1 Tax=Mycolicibacterium fortuitum TaxID=1766 RepID=UPI00148FCAB2|nr:hypothetical protein [Mycolicibacterium fortuitum]